FADESAVLWSLELHRLECVSSAYSNSRAGGLLSTLLLFEERRGSAYHFALSRAQCVPGMQSNVHNVVDDIMSSHFTIRSHVWPLLKNRWKERSNLWLGLA